MEVIIMKKGIYIDSNNKEQVEWFNKVASKLIKVSHYNEIIETSTKKVVGYCIAFDSLFSKYVIDKNNKFLGDNLTELVVKKKS
jgi:hypothetical protein